MASTISAARSALYTLLAANTYPGAQPQITFGPPDAYEEQEVVALMGVEAADENLAVFGTTGSRDEVFTIVVAIKVHNPGGTAQVVDARCWELADEVREVVYANQTLSGSLTSPGTARVSSQTGEGAQPVEGSGWVAFCAVRVLCSAGIT